MSQIFEYPASTRSENRSEIFDQMHNSQNWFIINEDGWHLPATLEKHDWCDSWFYRGCLNVDGHKNTVCEGKGFLKTFQRSCFRADCETCYKKWNGRESNKSTRRIEKYEKLSHMKVKHIIISVPTWQYSLEKKVLAKQAYKILKEVNCLGGAIVFHPFRYQRETKTWYYSPHFHVLGFGWIEAVAQAYNKHGWIVKNKGTRDSTFATFYYLLSHAGIKKHNHALVWFGDLSYCKLKLNDLDRELEKCPYCNNLLVELSLIGEYSHKPPDLICEIPIDVDDYAEVHYERLDEYDIQYNYHSNGRINSILEQIAETSRY